MAILKIARMGHPVLRRPAAPVEDPRAAAVRGLIDDMIETMHDAEGTGLAAPQVHEPRRIVVFFVAGERARAGEAAGDGDGDGEAAGGRDVPLTVLVNPGYEPLGEEMEEAWEACLSVPGLAGRVPRYTRIRYWGRDADGRAVERRAAGFHARVVQHELDHLDGILYPERMRDMRTLVFTSELNRSTPEETQEKTPGEAPEAAAATGRRRATA